MNIKRVACGFVAVLTLNSAFFIGGCALEHRHKYAKTENYGSSCVSDGYSYRICEVCGEVEYFDFVPAEGHKFNEWFDDIRYETRYAVCTACGLKEKDGEYVPPENFARFYISGNPGAVFVPIEAKYISKDGTESSFYGRISLDGSESNEYYKKDYDIEFYSDSSFKESLSIELDESLACENSYALKSEYYDMSGVRNFVSSELWYMVSETRKLPEQIAALPYHGADHGFPLIFYTNGNYKGLYNMCLANSEKLFGLDNEETQALVYSYPNFGKYDLKYQKSEAESVPCTVVFPISQEAKESAAEKFSVFADFIYSSSDAEFEQRISEFLDIDAAVDYLICVWLFGADENADNYCNWVTYDGKKWIPSMYNLTYTFGINDKGESIDAESTAAPYYADGKLCSGTNSVLWDKLCRNFEQRVAERYVFLRTESLNAENVYELFLNYISSIPQSVFDAELNEYPEKRKIGGYGGANAAAAWFAQKAEIVDTVFAYHNK